MSNIERGESSILVHDLVLPVDEAQEALAAIRSGQIDALVINGPNEVPRVFLLKGADDAHRVLLETLNEGALTIARDATILYANKRASEMLGRPLEEVLGAALTRFLSEEDGRELLAFLSGGTGAGKRETALFTASGARLPVMISMRSSTGDPEIFTLVLTDLSQLKEAEEALRRANDELEARVRARTAEIERVNAALRLENEARARLTAELRHKAEELAAADQRKDEFLSMLAHELRNPLSPILTAAQMLRRVCQSDPVVERYGGVIERQTRNLTHLVDDLLDVSRITRRTIALRKEPTTLAAIVRGAVETTQALLTAGGHVLEVDLPADPLHLHADPTRLEQVVVNLLNNAGKYSDRGARIRVSAAVMDGHLALSVRDNGSGIPPELLPHVFELFVQGHRSLARSQGGLGVGLTLVKHIVEMHHGSVEAHSDGVGKGTEIIVRLPLAPSPD